MSHTPGPWSLNRTLFDQSMVAWQIAAPKAGSKDPIAFGNDETLRSEKEEEANARLIAAAPALLNAVRFLLSNPDNRISHADTVAAQAAIAKAQG